MKFIVFKSMFHIPIFKIIFLRLYLTHITKNYKNMKHTFESINFINILYYMNAIF